MQSMAGKIIPKGLPSRAIVSFLDKEQFYNELNIWFAILFADAIEKPKPITALNICIDYKALSFNGQDYNAEHLIH